MALGFRLLIDRIKLKEAVQVHVLNIFPEKLVVSITNAEARMGFRYEAFAGFIYVEGYIVLDLVAGLKFGGQYRK